MLALFMVSATMSYITSSLSTIYGLISSNIVILSRELYALALMLRIA